MLSGHHEKKQDADSKSVMARFFKILLVLSLIIGSPVHAETFVGNPTNYRSLLSELKPGDSLLLEAGTYADGLPLDAVHGTQDQPIIISGPVSGAPATFLGRSCCNTVQIKDSSYIEIRHLTIDGQNISGIDGVNGRGITHHITLSDLRIVGHGVDQWTNGISTKGPCWDWIIRNNVILEAGTGVYLGNSKGDLPFIKGVIEHNLIVNTIGYNLQIKHQNGRSADIGIPGGDHRTIIRHNVFMKGANSSGGSLARPNLLVGHFPLSGFGSNDMYEIYGNFFYQNPSEALFQGEGNIALYNNLFVNDFGDAANIQPHNDYPRDIYVFHNTVVAKNSGIRVTGGASGYERKVVGNAAFASSPISSSEQSENITDAYESAVEYLIAPFAELGILDLYPKLGKLSGATAGVDLMGQFTDANQDFNGEGRTGVFRGAYAGEGVNPGWKPAQEIKPRISDESPEPPAEDTIPPYIDSVSASGTPPVVTVTFSEEVTATSAENTSNYMLDDTGVVITGARLGSDQKMVELEVSGLVEGQTYTLTVNNILDLAAAPNMIAANTQQEFLYETNSLVQGLEPTRYEVDILEANSIVYIDRDYTFTKIPTDYDGMRYLRTANDDKFSSGDGFVNFQVDRAVMVYVGYDTRNTPLPSWLVSWRDTGARMETSTDITFNLYTKVFESTNVSLGGNELGNSMYVVLLDPDSDTGSSTSVPDETSSSVSNDSDGGGGAMGVLIILLPILFVMGGRRGSRLSACQ